MPLIRVNTSSDCFLDSLECLWRSSSLSSRAWMSSIIPEVFTSLFVIFNNFSDNSSANLKNNGNNLSKSLFFNIILIWIHCTHKKIFRRRRMTRSHYIVAHFFKENVNKYNYFLFHYIMSNFQFSIPPILYNDTRKPCHLLVLLDGSI